MWRLFWGIFSLPLILVGLAAFNGQPVTGWALVNVAIYPLIVIASLAAHEGGHALVAHMVGLQVARVEVGVGRRLVSWRWRGATMALHSWPILGLTYVGSQRPEGIRWRLWLVTAAGPVVTLSVLVAAMRWSPRISLVEALVPIHVVAGNLAPRELLAFANVWMLALSLLPFSFARSAHYVSDGRRLLTLPFMAARRLGDLMLVPTLLEAQEHIDRNQLVQAQRLLDELLSRFPDSWAVRNAMAVVQLGRGELEAARSAFLRLSQEEPPQPEYLWVARNNLAWLDFRLRRDDLRSEADEHSREVFSHVPNAPWALATRGAVLVWLGNGMTAMPLLERAYHVNNSSSSRAEVACVLVLACVRTHRVKDAAQWLERAKRSDPSCPLLEEAATVLDAARK